MRRESQERSLSPPDPSLSLSNPVRTELPATLYFPTLTHSLTISRRGAPVTDSALKRRAALRGRRTELAPSVAAPAPGGRRRRSSLGGGVELVGVENEVVPEEDESDDGEEVDEDDGEEGGQQDGAGVAGDRHHHVPQRLFAHHDVEELRAKYSVGKRSCGFFHKCHNYKDGEEEGVHEEAHYAENQVAHVQHQVGVG